MQLHNADDSSEGSGTAEEKVTRPLSLTQPRTLRKTISRCDLLKSILNHTVPLVIDNIIITVSGFGDVIIIKKMGTPVVDAAAYISPIKNLSINPAIAVFTALQPLMSKEHVEEDYINIGRLWQSSILLGGVISLPLMIVLFPVEPILNAMGQDHISARLAATYFRFQLFSMPALFAIESTIQFWISTKMQYLVIPASIVRTALQLSFNSIFAYNTSLGINGWGIASLLQPWASLGLFLLYMKYDKRFYKFELFKRHAYNDRSMRVSEHISNTFKQILKLGLPTALQLFFIFGSKLGNTLLLGSFSKSALSAYFISSQYANWIIMIVSPLATTACVFISQAISKHDFKMIYDVGTISLAMGCTIAIATLPFLCTLQRPLTQFLLNSKEGNSSAIENVIDDATTVMPIVGASDIAFAIKYIMMGLFRGCEDTFFPMVVSILGAFIGFGLSTMLRFTSDEPAGVSIGELFGLLLAAVILLRQFPIKIKPIKEQCRTFAFFRASPTPMPEEFETTDEINTNFADKLLTNGCK